MAPATHNTQATATTDNKKSNENTLTSLTKRFVALLSSKSERSINLNEASTRLSVAKRRIYDITNVLEGIGLLKKTHKNLTEWIDCPRDSLFAASPTRDDELASLRRTYQSLEEGVKDLEAKIRQQRCAEGAYVTYQDIKSSFNEVVIAVRPPPEGATKLEVDENLKIHIKSEIGPIEAYYCPQHSSNTQPLDATITYSSNLIDQQQPVSSDEGRGSSTLSTTGGQYYDPGVSSDYYDNDPTLSSALSGGISEDDDPFRPIVPYEAREEIHYNYMLTDEYTVTSIFTEDNLGFS